MARHPLRVISLGWGVQSWTLAAMAALGDIEPVDYAVHADTTHEAQATYDHAAKWTPWLGEHGVTVVTVKANRPDVVREDKSDSTIIPAFTVNARTKKPAQLLRQCTHDWKIMPIRRFIRQKVDVKPGAVHSLQGISLDEWRRMRDSDVAYIVNVYPLVDLRMSRADCVAYLESKGLDVPPKSACVFCPYRSLGSWKDMKRVAGPDWDYAVAADSAIRHQRDRNGYGLYVHPARKPLAEAVKIPEDFGAHQMELDFEAPCDSGFCFV